jgi:hypothetical protein
MTLVCGKYKLNRGQTHLSCFKIVMAHSFSPSVNIIRDERKDLSYIPTENARRLFRQISNDYKLGIHSFNIVGSYGTGKSAFLWALERNLSVGNGYFGNLNGHFKGVKRFDILNIVGSHTSLLKSVATRVGVTGRSPSAEEVIPRIQKIYSRNSRMKRGLLLVIDELGKFLEHAAKNDPEKEIFFLQQLSEFCNDEEKEILFITSLHQGFTSYSAGLDDLTKNEWAKVEGRLKGLMFNEPVEQLLSLAAEHLHEVRHGFTAPSSYSKLLKVVKYSQIFPFGDSFLDRFAEKLMPFDVAAAAVLAQGLQWYGQNERSLFTFLESHDPYGMKDFQRSTNPMYNLSCVYDYFVNNLHSSIAARQNKYFVQWVAIQRAVERIDTSIEQLSLEAKKVVKSVGLLNIFSPAGSRINADLLNQYCITSLGVNRPSDVIGMLEKKKILRYRRFNDRYVLFEGTDLNIEAALAAAGERVDRPTSAMPRLKEYFHPSPILSKAAHYKRGTPRFFEFKLSNSPIKEVPTGEVDGIINLVFPERFSSNKSKKNSAVNHDAILSGVFKNSSLVTRNLWEIDKIQEVLKTTDDDPVATRELKELLNNCLKELDALVSAEMYGGENILWLFRGKEIRIRSKQDFRTALLTVCEDAYPSTPVFPNELVNRHKLPAAIASARKNLLGALTTHWNEKNLGISDKTFAPEKSIYLALLAQTGIHKKDGGGYAIGRPTDRSFRHLWLACEEFLKSTRHAPKPLSDLFEILEARPFKLKRGFLEFWVPIYLFARREDYALFREGAFVPNLSNDVFDLILRNPEKYEVKAFHISGLRLNMLNNYKAFLKQASTERVTSSAFIEIAKPFLTFYKGLPEYVKTTSGLSRESLELRNRIANARDPEKTFFEDLPAAMGLSLRDVERNDHLLKNFVEKIEKSIRELRACFEELLNRLEAHLLHELNMEGLTFPVYHPQISRRFQAVRKGLLVPYQRAFYSRLIAPLDDRRAWLMSVFQAILGKNVDLSRDGDEEMLREKLSIILKELDNLCDIAQIEGGSNAEEVVRVELTSASEGTRRELVRVPHKKSKSVRDLEKRLRKALSKDKSTNTVALVNLLKEIIRG